MSVGLCGKAHFCDILWVLVSSYLVVDGSRVGAVEFMICSHDVCEVWVSLTPQSLRRVALLTQVPSIACVGVEGQEKVMFVKYLQKRDIPPVDETFSCKCRQENQNWKHWCRRFPQIVGCGPMMGHRGTAGGPQTQLQEISHLAN